jgi:hypothetical protein
VTQYVFSAASASSCLGNGRCKFTNDAGSIGHVADIVAPSSHGEVRPEAGDKLSATHDAAESSSAGGFQFGGVDVRAECD